MSALVGGTPATAPRRSPASERTPAPAPPATSPPVGCGAAREPARPHADRDDRATGAVAVVAAVIGVIGAGVAVGAGASWPLAFASLATVIAAAWWPIARARPLRGVALALIAVSAALMARADASSAAVASAAIAAERMAGGRSARSGVDVASGRDASPTTPIAADGARADATVPATDDDAAFAAGVDAGRRLGGAAAPATLEVALSLECPRCATQWSALLAGLRLAVDRGDLAIVVRHVVHRRARSSVALVAWAFAAAARGGDDYLAFLAAMTGSRGDLPADALLAGPAGAALDLPGLARAAALHRRALDRAVADDALRIDELGLAGPTPAAVLIDRGGAELGRWRIGLPCAEIAAALARAR